MSSIIAWRIYVRACACLGAALSTFATVAAVTAVMRTPWTGAFDNAWIFGIEFGPLMLILWWRLYHLRYWAGRAFCLLGVILLWQAIVWDDTLISYYGLLTTAATVTMALSLRARPGVLRISPQDEHPFRSKMNTDFGRR